MYKRQKYDVAIVVATFRPLSEHLSIAFARFVSFEDLLSLLNDVHKSNSGPIERALREADIARVGQVRQ